MTKPDFTGTWRFNRELSSLQITAPDSTIFTIEHHEPAFRFSRTHIFAQKKDAFSMDLTTDGTMVETRRGDVTVQARAFWEGRTLVFDSLLTGPDDSGTNVVRYELAEDGNTITARESLRSSRLQYDNVWVMDRQL